MEYMKIPMKMNANSITLVLSIMSNKSHVTPLHLFLKRVRVSAIAYIKVKHFIKWGGGAVHFLAGCCSLPFHNSGMESLVFMMIAKTWSLRLSI